MNSKILKIIVVDNCVIIVNFIVLKENYNGRLIRIL